MRAVFRYARRMRAAYLLQERGILYNSVEKRTIRQLVNRVQGYSFESPERSVCERLSNLSLISRGLYTGSSSSTTESIEAGPLVEYERRIAAGELVDGDDSQVFVLFMDTAAYHFWVFALKLL
ncbi:peroxisome-assembly ATPase [Ranunculus cassubicifolius]